MRKTEYAGSKDNIEGLVDVSLTCLSSYSNKSMRSPKNERKLFSPARFEQENMIPLKTPNKRTSGSFITPVNNNSFEQGSNGKNNRYSPQSETKYNFTKASTLNDNTDKKGSFARDTEVFVKSQLMRPPIKLSFTANGKQEGKNPFLNNPMEQKAARVIPAPPSNEEASKSQKCLNYSSRSNIASPENANRNKGKGDQINDISIAGTQIQTEKHREKSLHDMSNYAYKLSSPIYQTPKQHLNLNKKEESFLSKTDTKINPFGKEGKEIKIVYQTPKQEISCKKGTANFSVHMSKCDFLKQESVLSFDETRPEHFEEGFQKNQHKKQFVYSSNDLNAVPALDKTKHDESKINQTNYDNNILLFEEVSEIVMNSRHSKPNVSILDQTDVSEKRTDLVIPSTSQMRNPASFMKKLNDLRAEMTKKLGKMMPPTSSKVECKDNITQNPSLSAIDDSLQNFSINDIVFRGTSMIQTNRSHLSKTRRNKNLDRSSKFETLRTKDDFQKEMIMLSVISFNESLFMDDDDDEDINLIPDEGDKRNLDSLKQRLNSPRVKIQSQKLKGSFFKLLKRAQKYFIPSLVSSIFHEEGDKHTLDHKLLMNFRETFFQMFDEREQAHGYNYPSDAEIAHKKLRIPRRPGFETKKTLLLDLDETLIHCNSENTTEPCDVTLAVKLPNGQKLNADIVIRPHLKEFLKRMNKYYEIFIFTASHEAYAKVLVDYIDKNRRIVQGYFSRDHCICTDDGAYVKDLRIFNRNLKDIVIVDNLIYSYAFQIHNGIPILPFENNKNDSELLTLIDYLKFVASMDDVREVNKRFFKLDHFLESDDPEEIAIKYFSDFVPRKTEGIL